MPDRRAEAAATGLRPVRADSQVFIVDGAARSGSVIAYFVSWREGVMPDVQQSLFNPPDTLWPDWPATPLRYASSGLELASGADVIAALRSPDPRPSGPTRYGRSVFVLMTNAYQNPARKRLEVRAAGVFINRSDAEDARALMAEHVEECWIEAVPIGI
ncbi:hypothetical protein Afil01_28380 [Actinorhabdospora filicis]|uniref:Uncharacterized protein n=1 Tax=Actinorhabdospora filicis TaxID=1785913 RepID=A0A9W6SLK9_9ACTN|nr:hypothetical protein [Actinorhabdospora filicis]GLZ78031.1 hypothetical protein Afil01_28380 [Actinorhabdospora filicis]